MNDTEIKLTDLEIKVLDYCRQSSEGNGHDFGLIEEVVAELKGQISAQTVGGALSSLSKKGIIDVAEPVTTDSGEWTQFVLKECYRS